MFSFTESSTGSLFGYVDSQMIPEQIILSPAFDMSTKPETPLFSIRAPIHSALKAALPPMEWEDNMINPAWTDESPATSNFLAQDIAAVENSLPHDTENDSMMLNFFNFDAASRPE